jgi:hypothetical protein
MELAVATLQTDLEGALALGPRALALAETGRSVLASASFEAEALVLGALQLEDTLRARSPARFDVPVVRRSTTGTEAQLSGAVLYHALALPRVDALFPDASARTLLNRNLRALLRGYAAAGVPLRYFGTEVLALLGHPVALVGYDMSESGAVLIEVLVGLQQPCVVRPALRREPPAGLYTLRRSEADPAELLGRAVDGVVSRLEATAVTAPLPPAELALTLLEPTSLPASVAIPLGVVEAVSSPCRVFGDLLVGTAALKRFEATADLQAFAGAPLDGARPADVQAALELARGRT